MVDTIVDWEGTFRDDFDTKYSSLTTTAGGIVDTLAARVAALVADADDANEAQARYNTAAQT